MVESFWASSAVSCSPGFSPKRSRSNPASENSPSGSGRSGNLRFCSRLLATSATFSSGLTLRPRSGQAGAIVCRPFRGWGEVVTVGGFPGGCGPMNLGRRTAEGGCPYICWALTVVGRGGVKILWCRRETFPPFAKDAKDGPPTAECIGPFDFAQGSLFVGQRAASSGWQRDVNCSHSRGPIATERAGRGAMLLGDYASF
jgi:hypothetical protein